MHGSKVTDCLLYVTFFSDLFQILEDGSCLCIVQCQNNTQTMNNVGSVQQWKDSSY